MTYEILLFKVLGALIGIVVALTSIHYYEKYSDRKHGQELVKSLKKYEKVHEKHSPNKFPIDSLFENIK